MKRGITALLLVLGAAAFLFLLEQQDDRELPSLLPPSAPASASPRAPPLGPEGTWTLTGRVRTLEGEPVPGVRVRVARVTPPERAGWARAWIQAIRAKRRQAREAWATTTTRADGTFAVPDLSPTHDHEVRVVSSSDRRIGSCATVDAGDRPHLELRVVRATWLFGQVVDSNGRGTPALLSLWIARRTTHWGTSDVSWWSDGERATGEDGRFRLRVPAGALHLDARRRGYRGVSLRHLHAHATFFVRIPLEDGAGATIAGRVTDEAGEAVAGALVVARRAAERWRLLWKGPLPRAITDAEGHYLFSDLEPATDWVLQATASGLVSAFSMGVVVESEGPGRRNVWLHLAPPASLAGRVVDANGDPIRRFPIQIEDLGEGGATDDEGRFAFDGLGPATYRLDVGPRFEACEPVSFSRPVRAGQARKDVELVFPNTLEIAGRVVDEDGRPAPDVQLFVELVDEVGSSSERTDEAGRFRFRWLAPGDYALSGGRIHRPEPVKAGTSDLELVRQAVRTATVEGLVLAPDGSPVPGADVRVSVGLRLHGGAFRSGRVQDGRFMLSLRRGRGTVEVEIEDARDTADVLLNVRPFRQTLPAFPATPLRLQLEAGLVVSGSIVDAAGAGVRGAYRIAGLAPAPTVVMVRAPSGKAYWRWRYLPMQQVVQPDSLPVDLRLEEGVRIRASVLTPDGRPARACFVVGHRVTGPGETRDPRWAAPHFRTYRGSTHRFLSSLVRPGDYEVRAFTDELHGDARKVTVTVPGDVVRLRLTEAHLVRGRLGGEDLQGFEVQWWVEEPREYEREETDVEGRFVIKASGAAAGLLYAYRDRDPRYALLRDVRASGGVHELVLRPGARIEGRLSGMPADTTGPAYVLVRNALGFRRSERLSVQGAFSILGLPPGTYELEFFGARLEGHVVQGPRKVEAGGQPLALKVRRR